MENMTEKTKREVEEKKQDGPFAGKPKNKPIESYGYNSASGTVYNTGEENAATAMQKPPKVMGAGVPYLVAGLVWLGLAFVTPIYKLSAVVIVSIVALVVGLILSGIRKKQIAKQPPAPDIKDFADEIAGKLYDLNNLVIDKAAKVKNKDLRDTLGSIAVTLSKMADEVENDPEDRNKVRKLANYYGDMLVGLIDKYIEYEGKSAAGSENGTMVQSMEKIENAITGVDGALKKLMDSLFKNDAMEISAEINTLDSLMNLELNENKKGAMDIADAMAEEVTIAAALDNLTRVDAETKHE